MAQLALDHVQGHPLTRHLDGVSVPKLMRGEPAPDARPVHEPAKLRPR